MGRWRQLSGVIQKGHHVASRRCLDPRFPEGTIQMQKPHFKKLGCDLDAYYPGTINLNIAPFLFRITRARFRFNNLRWSSDTPPENFSLADCRILTEGKRIMNGLLYYPHPETKPEHFQAPEVMEIITFHIERITYGQELLLEIDSHQVEIYQAA